MLQRVDPRPVQDEGGAQRALRSAFGRFPTGVTVVTMAGADGNVHCMTVNSFTTLSLEPPLVMWALRNSSTRHEVLAGTDRFAVSVLAASQVDLARRHAAFPPQLQSLALWPALLDDVPVIEGAAAHFVCRRSGEMPQGDHLLLFGEVLRFAEHGHEPLLFMAGSFYSGQGLQRL